MLRLRKAVAVTVAASASASAAAFAQATVPRAPVIANYSACVARQSPGVARALMATPLESREERRLARQLYGGNSAGCMDGRAVLSSNIGEIRGTVAEALLEREAEALARLGQAPAQPAVRAVVAEGRLFVANYARCIADADPAKSVRMLAAEPRSPEERDVLLSFGDTLNDCMPMGVAYRIDRFDVRNHIAVRLYEVATAGRPEGAR